MNIDLHVHIGASVPVHILYEISREEGLALPKNIRSYDDFVKAVTIGDKITHKKYLDNFNIPQFCQSSPLAIEKSMFHAVSAAYRKSRITTLELRMNPMMRNRNRGDYNIDSIIESAIIGLKRATMVYPEVKAGIIIETDRTFSPDQGMILAEKAVKYKSLDCGVIAFDLSGHNHKDFDISSVYPVFEYAKDNGLGITVHTGETTGCDEILKVIKHIKPDRIGHGVACINDNRTMDQIRHHNIILELCPSSNMRLGVINGLDEFRNVIKILQKKGVDFTINSDGPEFLRTTVNKEINMLINNGIIENDDLYAICDNSSSFLYGHRANY